MPAPRRLDRSENKGMRRPETDDAGADREGARAVPMTPLARLYKRGREGEAMALDPWDWIKGVDKNLWPQFALFSSTCGFSPPVWFRLHATFESGKELRSPQSSESELAGQQALLFRWY